MARSGQEIDTIFDGPARAKHLLILAHGAGAPMDSLFMNNFARDVAAGGVRVARFEFPYMNGRRSGKRRPPDREPVLRRYWIEIVEQLRKTGQSLFIGGKSMGGRIASMEADSLKVDGLVCVGYPFHPPGKPEKTRVAHLEGLQTPALIVQGTRDALGNTADVESYVLSKSIDIAWLEDGDHSFKPRKASGRTLEANMDEAVARVVAFVRSG